MPTEWQRKAACELLGVEPIELPGGRLDERLPASERTKPKLTTYRALRPARFDEEV